MKNYTFAPGTAIVTGAASGIGEALAHGLATRGSSLVLLDRDVDRLMAVATSIGSSYPGLIIDTVVVDLSDTKATDEMGAQLAAEHPETTLLINCAGVALGGTFDQLTLDEFNWLMDINFRAVVTLTHHLLPVLQRHPGAHLANVSSVFGIIAPPGQSAYVSSKFAVRGFTEAIRSESYGRGVGVTVIHPGGIKTRIADTARSGSGVPANEAQKGRDAFNRFLTIAPESAARVILNGIERRKERVLIGASAKLPDIIARIAPAHTIPILNRIRPSR